MARASWLGWAVAAAAAGCVTAPPADNPAHLRRPAEEIENPVLVSPGSPTPGSYREVFEKCLDVVDDYFPILSANPVDGRIVTKPRIAPGYEQVWKGGNPDPRERLLATFQTIRQTAVVEVKIGNTGGYLVTVIVEKELEDIPRPSRQRGGSAVFQEAPTVDRQLDVVAAATVAGADNTNWFRIGRDCATEQLILRRIRECR
ncbi:MAG: hypothetical protein K2X82_29135 [Gemmataceae bacterium]|nr:hypothetical protein [Gemmataceae bacterium]